MFEVVKEGFLHHVRHFVTFKGGADQNDGPHGRHHVVRRDGLCLLKERFPLLFGTGTAGSARNPALVQFRVSQGIGIISGSGRSGPPRIGALAVGEDVVEGAQIGRRGGLSGVESGGPTSANSAAAEDRGAGSNLPLLLDPQGLEFHRTRYETDIRVLLHQTSYPPVVVVLFLFKNKNDIFHLFKEKRTAGMDNIVQVCNQPWDA